MIYRFGEAELDSAAFELRVGGERQPIEPQVFEVLLYLVEHRERLCSRTELLEAIWGDQFVSDSALSSRIAAARGAIGDDGRAQRMIRTVHGRGLQFVAPVTETEGAAPPGLMEVEDLDQTVRFCRARDGAQLAIATVGDGPPLVKVANWLTHVEHDWNSPVWHHWTRALGDRFRFIRYDARGCGLSDRDLRGARLDDIDTWTSDLEAVVDACGLDQFVLLGVSQGAGPAMDYCVHHPDRVSHLVIYGGYARGMRRRGLESAGEAELLTRLIPVAWGGTNPAFRSVFTSTFLPAATSEQMRWFNELQVQSATAENALLIESAFHDHDFSELAQRVHTPTLVLHCRDDRATPFAEGRRLAALIPNAELVTLDSPNHILTADEPAWADFLRHIDRFTETRQTAMS